MELNNKKNIVSLTIEAMLKDNSIKDKYIEIMDYIIEATYERKTHIYYNYTNDFNLIIMEDITTLFNLLGFKVDNKGVDKGLFISWEE